MLNLEKYFIDKIEVRARAENLILLKIMKRRYIATKLDDCKPNSGHGELVSILRLLF